MTDLKWAPLVGAVVISKRSWEQIPEGLRPKFREAARMAGRRLQGRIRELGREAVEAMQKHGLTVHKVPEATVAAWEQTARAGYGQLVDVIVPAEATVAAWEQTARAGYGQLVDVIVPAEMVAEVERLRDEYRERNRD
jgi:TRAP-type C4-dicarboxylate transport system substrate-binding protein